MEETKPKGIYKIKETSEYKPAGTCSRVRETFGFITSLSLTGEANLLPTINTD